jgi:hypothetical protein
LCLPCAGRPAIALASAYDPVSLLTALMMAAGCMVALLIMLPDFA